MPGTGKISITGYTTIQLYELSPRQGEMLRCDACESGRDTATVLGVLWLRNRFRFLTGYDNLYNRFVTINKKVGGVHGEAQVAGRSQKSAAYQKL